MSFRRIAMHALLSLLIGASLKAGNVRDLPQCGDIYAPPFANPADAGRRACPPTVPRQYGAKHRGLGYEMLNLESEVCFVPDDMYRLLDVIIDDSIARIKAAAIALPARSTDDARAISTLVGQVLASRSFGLHIPTETLGDALVSRNKPNEPERHVFDCDTGSFIYLSVADALKLPMTLVEITLPSDAGHNYVRWKLPSGATLDWDTNGRAECATPSILPSYQGKSMTHDQIIGYAHAIRAAQRQAATDYAGAVGDFRRSMKLYPESPLAANNLAWMISTKTFVGREQLKEEAVALAMRAVSVARSANYLDTLACTFAFKGDFEAAARTATEVIALNPSATFRERLARFTQPTPQDCSGLD